MMKPGQTFADRFKIEELIGLGAYGAVYRVKQLSTGATRALKVLRDELGARMEVQQRFNEEATLAARIDSDHVAQIIDAGSRPRPWIAMELVEGDTLRARVKKGHPLPISEVLLILSQLAHGVAAAHRAQIVHRDLKPDNILISNARHSGAEFTTKIVDFGIARYRPREIEITKGAVGATMWMAPEQLEPTKSHEILPQADIWALD